MRKFKDILSESKGLKKVNLAQRRKQAIRMAKLAKSSAFKKKVERSKLRVASPEKIKTKAAKLAKQKVLDKFYPQYKDMPVAQRVKVDQMVNQRYGAMINKIATKSVKVVKQKELQKVKDARQSKQDA